VRIEEALLQVVPYAGFPRALAAFAAARGALGAADPAAGTEPQPASAPERGAGAFAAVYGDTAPRVREGLRALHPLLPAWTADFAYGRVLSRDPLDPATREVLAVALLTALGRCDDALLGHLRAAVRLGVVRDAIAGAIAVVPSSAGEGKRAAARALLERL
jgi:4-carboxymuconolactone decarboxylase